MDNNVTILKLIIDNLLKIKEIFKSKQENIKKDTYYLEL